MEISFSVCRYLQLTWCHSPHFSKTTWHLVYFLHWSGIGLWSLHHQRVSRLLHFVMFPHHSCFLGGRFLTSIFFIFFCLEMWYVLTAFSPKNVETVSSTDDAAAVEDITGLLSNSWMLTESVLLNSAYSLEVPATACFLQNSVVSLSMLSRSVIASISVSRSSALVGPRPHFWRFIGLSRFKGCQLVPGSCGVLAFCEGVKQKVVSSIIWCI